MIENHKYHCVSSEGEGNCVCFVSDTLVVCMVVRLMKRNPSLSRGPARITIGNAREGHKRMQSL
jgi:hypothetical protein